MNFKSRSKEGQDILVHKLFGYNKGVFLDVGCNHPVKSNNTYELERLGWRGLLFDWKEDASLFLNRKSPYFKMDVTSPKFIETLNRESMTDVDYISLDVDASSEVVLQNILDNNIKFKVMTFEHNSYADGGLMRDSSRKRLLEKGYKILFGDVRLHRRRVIMKGKTRRRIRNWGTFEDWWINPNFFAEGLLSRAKNNTHWQDCLNLL